MERAGVVDRLIGFLAALSCVVLALGLVDTPRQPILTTPVARLPEGTARDAELAVLAVDRADRPLDGVLFTVFWKRGEEYFWSGRRRSSAQGAARFSDLPRGVVWLVAEKDGYERTSTQLALSDAPREARVQLGPGFSTRIVVRDASGDPLPRATVLVESTDPLPHGALTGQDGAANFDRLGPAPWQVRVSAQGFETQRFEASDKLEVTLRRLGALSVFVVDADGRPVPEATVVIAGAKLWPSRRTSTNAQGVATITGLLDGAYDLRAMKGQRVSNTLFGFTLADGKTDEVTLTLAPGRFVQVQVVEGDGQSAPAVADADVVLVESGIGSFPLRGRSGPDGSLELGPIPRGPAWLTARASGFVARSGVPVPEDESGPVRIGLQRGATLQGSVVDVDGYPIAGASIEIIGSDLFGFPISESPLLMNFSRAHFNWALAGPVAMVPAGELGVMPGPVPPIPGLSGGLEVTLDPFSLEVDADAPIEPWVTRANGEFTAHPVTPGRVRALVRHPDFVEALSDAVTLAPGARGTVRVELFRGGVLEGRVNDHRGFPIAGASVELSALKGTYERYATTATDGSFAFAAVPKQIIISISRPDQPGLIALREHLEVSEGKRNEVELNLPESRGEVEIVVVGERDAPIELAQVRVVSLDSSVPRRETVFTDASGQVRIAGLQGLPLQVSVEALGWAPAERQLETAPAAVSIGLQRGVTLSGEVTSVRGRVGVRGAQVTLLSRGQRRLSLTDERGRFEFENVPLGTADLSVEHPDFAKISVPVNVRDTGRADRPQELPPIDLVEPGSVSGTVVDKDGEPVQGARIGVGLVPAFMPAGALPPGFAISDADGHFTLRGLAPGNVSLGAYAAGIGRGQLRDVAVDSGREVGDVVLRLVEPAEDDTLVTRGNVAITLGERGTPGAMEVVVIGVAEASEAERAGFRAGDRVVSVAGEQPRDMLEARLLMAGAVGSHVLVEVRRAADRLLLTVVREQVRR